MKNITTKLIRLTLLCLALAGLGHAAQAQTITPTIEAQVKGYTGYVLIDTSLASGSKVVWNASLGRYVSGAVKRGEALRLSATASGTTLASVKSTGTSPVLNLTVSGTSYVNTTTTVTTQTAVTTLTWRASSPSGSKTGSISATRSAPIVGTR